jgi:hypothetical protein
MMACVVARIIETTVTPPPIISTVIRPPVIVKAIAVPLISTIIQVNSNEGRIILPVTDGQTIFDLVVSPFAPSKTKVFIEPVGIKLEYGIDFTITGSILALLPAVGVALEDFERLEIYYY